MMTDRFLSFHDLLRWLAYGNPSEDAEHAWQESQRGKLSPADWNDTVISKHEETVAAILREGRNGTLTVLGRRGEYATRHEPIPHTDLINARIDELWGNGEAAIFLQPKRQPIGTDPLWVDLCFDRANVLEVWPQLAINQQLATAGKSGADKKAPTSPPQRKRKGGKRHGLYFGSLKNYLRWYDKNVPDGLRGSAVPEIADGARKRLATDGVKGVPTSRSAFTDAIKRAIDEIAPL
jgi:hypothetical protein